MIIPYLPINCDFDPNWSLFRTSFVQVSILSVGNARFGICIKFAFRLGAHLVQGVGVGGIANGQMGLNPGTGRDNVCRAR